MAVAQIAGRGHVQSQIRSSFSVKKISQKVSDETCLTHSDNQYTSLKKSLNHPELKRFLNAIILECRPMEMDPAAELISLECMQHAFCIQYPLHVSALQSVKGRCLYEIFFFDSRDSQISPDLKIRFSEIFHSIISVPVMMTGKKGIIKSEIAMAFVEAVERGDCPKLQRSDSRSDQR